MENADRENPEVNLTFETKIRDVEAIADSWGQPVDSENIADYVELPLLAACRELYDKNIKTLSSTANQKDIDFRGAVISIDWDTLSAHNKGVVEELIKGNKADKSLRNEGDFHVYLRIPLSEEDTVGTVSEKAVEISKQFAKQEFRWGGQTLEQLWKMFGKEGLDHRTATEEWGFKYNADRNLYYWNEEYYEKSLEKVPEE